MIDENKVYEPEGLLEKIQKNFNYHDIKDKDLFHDRPVDENDIAEIVAMWTGIPVSKVNETESERLLNMENILHKQVIGQNEAVTAISRAIRRARVGLKNPNRPTASFLFCGPTGVGKTELTKTLASSFFGSEKSMVRLDMSEYMEKHTVAKLIGAPPGYVGYTEGGQLTEAIRRQPYSLVLFDEVEKAHPDIFNLLLQILDEGRLSDSQGRVVNFKNTILILTSNLGSELIHNQMKEREKTQLANKQIGYARFLEADEILEEEEKYKKLTEAVNRSISQFFRPEFVNRLDEIIIFRPLTKVDIEKIADLMIKDLIHRAREQEMELIVSPTVREMVSKKGYSSTFGARPLRRIITKLVEDEIALKLLESTPNKEKNNIKILVDLDYRNNVIVKIQETPKRVVEEKIDLADLNLN